MSEYIAPLLARLGYWLVGFGLMCVTASARRAALWQWLASPSATAAVGIGAVVDLNSKAQTDEIARRHAKPSTRRRWEVG